MPHIQHRESGTGRTYAWIADDDGSELSRLTIDHRTMLVSESVNARIAAVGNVFTASAARGKGLARQLMDAVPSLAPDAELAVLFGIDGYYLNQGYERAGDEWLFSFPVRDSDTRHSARLNPRAFADFASDGWTIAQNPTAPTLTTIHQQDSGIGTLSRGMDEWQMMSGMIASANPGANRSGTLTSATSPAGTAEAVAWRDDDHGVCAEIRRSLPPTAVYIPELLATTTAGALAMLTHAASTHLTATSIVVSAHPNSVVASLVDHLDAQVTQTTRPNGGLITKLLPAATAHVQSALKDAGPVMWVALPDRW